MDSQIDLFNDLTRWILAFAGATGIALLAHHLRALSPSGAVAAVILGMVVVGAGGWWAGVVLIAFFATSTLLSQRGNDRTTVLAARGNRRDAVQVMANGGVAFLASLAYAMSGDAAWLMALGGSLAAANADTWSTEIGRTNSALPRLVTTGRPVPAGTSGAISARGIAAAIAGSGLIALVAAPGIAAGWMPASAGWLPSLAALTLGGFAGSLVDSLLGATLQVHRWCDTCERATERAIHGCGTATRRVAGLRWVTNDVVNAACIMTGALVTTGMAAIIS